MEISNLGSSVSTNISATNIANPVKVPKMIVGMKFDRIRIEKPNITVMPVKNIALPMLE